MHRPGLTTPLTRDHTDPDLSIFLKLSAELTGFSQEELQKTGMVETYYYVLMMEENQDGIRSFFMKADETLQSSDVHAAIEAELFTPMLHEGLAQRIILLWYTGVWTSMNAKNKKSEQERTAMISAQAYKQGLIWTVAGTHPAGARQPGFKSWSKEPVELQKGKNGSRRI